MQLNSEVKEFQFRLDVKACRFQCCHKRFGSKVPNRSILMVVGLRLGARGVRFDSRWLRQKEEGFPGLALGSAIEGRLQRT